MVPISRLKHTFRSSDFLRALGLDDTQGTHATHTDGSDAGDVNRYRTGCLGQIVMFSETYNHLRLDPAMRHDAHIVRLHHF